MQDRYLNILFSVSLLFLFTFTQDSYAKKLVKPDPPVDVETSGIRLQGNTVHVTIKAIANHKFTDGYLYITLKRYRDPVIDSIPLWTGKSDSLFFKQDFQYTFPLPIKNKARITAEFRIYSLQDSVNYSQTSQHCFYSLQDTLLQAVADYGGLYRAYANYLIYQKGYEHLTDKEIQVRDLKLWRRLFYLRGRKYNKDGE